MWQRSKTIFIKYVVFASFLRTKLAAKVFQSILPSNELRLDRIAFDFKYRAAEMRCAAAVGGRAGVEKEYSAAFDFSPLQHRMMRMAEDDASDIAVELEMRKRVCGSLSVARRVAERQRTRISRNGDIAMR